VEGPFGGSPALFWVFKKLASPAASVTKAAGSALAPGGNIPKVKAVARAEIRMVLRRMAYLLRLVLKFDS
jgi:hypothetical protein